MGGSGLQAGIKGNMTLLQGEAKMRARIAGNFKQPQKEMKA